MSEQMNRYVPQSPTKRGRVNPRFMNGAWCPRPPLAGWFRALGELVTWQAGPRTGGRADPVNLGAEGRACRTASVQGLSGPGLTAVKPGGHSGSSGCVWGAG